NRTRRSFRPSLEGFRLENRVALAAAPAAVVAAAAVEDPLVQPPNVTLKASKVQATLDQLHTAYMTFLRRVQRACTTATTGLANGQTPAALLTSLKTYTGLQGGVLQSQVERAARGLPGGDQYLFTPPQGFVPGGYPMDGSCGPDLRYYVHPE